MKVERAVHALQVVNPMVDPIEVAEVLWLAALTAAGDPQARRSPDQGLAAEQASTAVPATPTEPNPGSEPAAADAGPSGPANRETGPQASEADRGESIEVRRPRIPTLPASVRLVRALRPLNRRAPGRTGVVLDEEATARHRADFGFWLPMVRPVDRRWLDLLVITDASPPMDIWRSLANELRLELGRSRIFQNLQHRYLRSSPTGPRLSVDAAGADVRTRREVVQDTHQRAVVVITDGVDPFWHTRPTGDLLRFLAQHAPTAIVQPLPQRLWPRTSLPAEVGRLTAFGPPTSNQAMRFTPAIGRSPSSSQIHLPVFEIQQGWLAGWATLVSGGSLPEAAVVSIGDDWGKAVIDHGVDGAAANAATILRRFRSSASPTALRLAARLAAAAPLTLPIIRYVKQATLPSAGPTEIAEVFLGGLLRRTTPVDRSDPDTTEYDFHPGIRERLIDMLSPREAGEVSETLLSAVLDQNLTLPGADTSSTTTMTRSAEPLNLPLGPLVQMAEWTLRRLTGGGAAQSLAEARQARPSHGALRGAGGFAGLFRLNTKKYRRPVLCTTIHGLGVKTAIAQAMNIHDTVGIDLVAMVVNDLVACGAEPLFLLDNITCGEAAPDRVAEIRAGIADGCRYAGYALLGGETVEHPGLMRPDQYDISGTGVGVVEEHAILGRDRVGVGDVIIALRSTGLHTNGYSLVRHVLISAGQMRLDAVIDEFGSQRTLGEELLTPTRIYAKDCLDLITESEVHAFAHVAGGGIPGNLVRVLPETVDAVVDRSTWRPQPIFELVRNKGRIEDMEMESTFNMGVGMLAVVSAEEADRTLAFLAGRGLDAWQVGEVIEGVGQVQMVGSHRLG